MFAFVVVSAIFLTALFAWSSRFLDGSDTEAKYDANDDEDEEGSDDDDE